MSENGNSSNDITRKQALKQMGGLALGGAGLFSSMSTSTGKVESLLSNVAVPGVSEKPNILWIVSEDNSASYLGCYGNEQATTPRLDQLASEGILYENTYSASPVCAPTRSTMITGVYANSMGTQHMRSTYPIPDFIRFYPYYLRQAGYYCTNNSKTDYNTADKESWTEVWDESSNQATYRNRPADQPFFAVFNLETSHESRIHNWIPVEQLSHDPQKMREPAYLPDTPEVRHDLAQYYDKIQKMDGQVGQILDQLEKDGLADDTIVIYNSDHGGVLPRSKRYCFENGLHIPLIVRFPEKYQHLAPAEPGSTNSHLVNEVDFTPTLLSLASAEIPEYYQGRVFLGPQKQPSPHYTFGFRGRMDGTYDMVRTVRDEHYRYKRNYMPNRIYGQHIWYLWKAPSMQSWQQAYQRGQCDKAQSKFWQAKPPEELYDVQKDPDNVNNLAGDPNYSHVLKRMRQANSSWVRRIHDAGFMPEAMMVARSKKANTTIYQYVRSEQYPQERIISMAEIATMVNPKNLTKLRKGLKDPDAAVRYWAAYGCAILEKNALPAKRALIRLLNDPFPEVALAASEALYYLGEELRSFSRLKKALNNHNDKVRLYALNIIRTFGVEAMPMLPKLQNLLIHPGPHVGENYGTRVDTNIIVKLTKAEV